MMLHCRWNMAVMSYTAQEEHSSDVILQVEHGSDITLQEEHGSDSTLCRRNMAAMPHFAGETWQ